MHLFEDIFPSIIILISIGVILADRNLLKESFSTLPRPTESGLNLENPQNSEDSDIAEEPEIENVSWCDPTLCGHAVDVQHIACQNFAVLLNTKCTFHLFFPISPIAINFYNSQTDILTQTPTDA